MMDTVTLDEVSARRRMMLSRIKCPECGEELVTRIDNLPKNIVLYNPRQETYKYWQGGFGPENERIGTRWVSSDMSKDYVEIKCCSCGHQWNVHPDVLRENRCDWKGEDVMCFELSEAETKKAREFIKAHNHREDFAEQGKMGFSTLGQQFTYTITPGGLGPMVNIKCNHCGEKRDITCYEDW